MTKRSSHLLEACQSQAAEFSEAKKDVRLLALVESQLQSKGYGLTFGRELEQRFEADTREKRVHDIRRTIVLGLVVFHIYNVAAFVTTPDLAMLNMALRVLCMTPLACVIIWAVGWVSGPLREAIGGIGMLFATAIPVLIFWMGSGPLVPLTTATIWLSVVFANITLPLRFFWACFVSGATALAVMAGLYAKAEIGAPVAGVLGLDMVTGILFSLVATYRIESASRRDYLVNLREMLRGKRLAADNTTLAHLSSTDPLTGIANRRAFARELGASWIGHLAGRPFAVILLDIDHFKTFNDHYGHGAGDTCLRDVASVLAELAAESGAFAARYGGEEFAILAPSRSPDAAFALADGFRRSIVEERLTHSQREDGLGFVSASVGVATSCGSPNSASALVEAADAALYAAKSAGRNRTCGSQPTGDASRTDRPNFAGRAGVGRRPRASAG